MLKTDQHGTIILMGLSMCEFMRFIVLIRLLVAKLANRLSADRSWEKFLPPVAVRDNLYMVTENGSIYRMSFDAGGYELISEIKRGY